MNDDSEAVISYYINLLADVTYTLVKTQAERDRMRGQLEQLQTKGGTDAS